MVCKFRRLAEKELWPDPWFTGEKWNKDRKGGHRALFLAGLSLKEACRVLNYFLGRPRGRRLDSWDRERDSPLLQLVVRPPLRNLASRTRSACPLGSNSGAGLCGARNRIG